MTKETRNIMVATCLSLLVVLGWDAFYSRPHLDKERQTQAEMHARAVPGAQANSQPTRSRASGVSAPEPAEPSAPQKSRADALAESPRVKLDAPAIYGSIALKGGRIDDVSFKDYRETVDPNSPNIVLLSPAGSPWPYYAEAGFIADPGANLVLPGPDTLWQADHDTLTETSPVTLTYDNGRGLVFRRKIAVDDRYMFTVTDSVENKSTQAVTLHPYAFVKRHGMPVTTGFYRVHEGFVGVIGESGVQEIRYNKIEKEDHATKSFAGTGGWLGLTDKYWAAVVIPDQGTAVEASYSGSGGAPVIYQAGFAGTEGRTLAPGASSEFTSRVFAGAKETATLDKYQ
ncbi:MAG: membrane protein insertase YidC, partial [Methylocella sp.]